ncbi:MAG TPA: flagellar basal-body MS-ring/collar protein FliF [Gryllotalpicola sp.]
MPASLRTLLRRLGDYVRGFSAAQRTVAVIGVAVVVLGGIALASWLSRPSYAPLFTGLQASDASAIVDQLTSDGVPYQLEDGGGTVLVPQGKVYAERLKAAANSLPSSTTSGYALLDKMGVTASQFQQDVTYKQAMEEELANTIQAMNGVKTASVKLAIPQETVFTEQKADPTASVFVATAGNQALSDDQVDAIVHLTSASVPDMKPADVSVVDAQGETLSAVGGTTTDAAGKSQNAYEVKTQQSLQKMLDTIVGPGNSTVAISADVNPNTAQQTTTQFSAPTGSPAATESAQSESYSGTGGSGSTGVLGPDNIAGPTAAGGNGNYQNSSSSKSNALNQTTTNTTIPPGAVTRQTVSVAVSAKAAGSVNLQQLTQLVQSAAGYDNRRGDIVTVQAVPFSTSAAAAAQNALADSARQQAQERQAQLLRTGVLAGSAALVLIAAIVAAAIVRRRSAGPTLLADEIVDDDELAALLPSLAQPALEPIEPAQPEPLLPPTLPLPAAGDALAVQKRELTALAASDPERTASLLRALMEQEVEV